MEYATTDEHERAIREMKAPMRELAWKLHNASFPDSKYDEIVKSNGFPPLLSLRCVAYVDQPQQSQTAFLYELPATRFADRTASVETLHTLMSDDSNKPSLGNRFFLAYALANTVLNIHISDWVHKNIWSHGIVVFRRSNPIGFSKSGRLIPYLAGWGLARPSDDETELAPDLEIEPNLYQHPVRQWQPTDYFSPEHDYYALGAVLIEIGLWTALSVVFKKQIALMTEEEIAPR